MTKIYNKKRKKIGDKEKRNVAIQQNLIVDKFSITLNLRE